MPRPATAVENLRKNLTLLERGGREAAEAETLPSRQTVKLTPPVYVTQDAVALEYWDATLRRMDGITLLDDLDSEMLGIYCSALSRRDAMDRVCRLILAETDAQPPDAAMLLEAMTKLDALTSKLQRQEAQLLNYAEKLGLTPNGRVRLARTRAEARLVDEGDDLFGD